MTNLPAALREFDRLTTNEAGYLIDAVRPRRVNRAEFRLALAEGRMSASRVLSCIPHAKAAACAQEAMWAAMSAIGEIELSRRPRLQVVA